MTSTTNNSTPSGSALDDDGVVAIMVLRTSATRSIDLTESITCTQRAGDDW
jgi:hypothetical protein